ncbi:hypothetical protein O3M35_000624 [Rhynocoris fuscipes]|uniref:tRNA-uridine aminocarboxypropyltransferase 1 n=1 Tax=Rhynocoris fuscipes TaxID=488301 RepID=A0AAW1DMF8_9HEMI
MVDNSVLVNDDQPFAGLNISETWNNLHHVSERTICPQCNKSRKYFCYTCYLPVAEIKEYVPNIKLPLKVDIIKHSREIDGKSTAVHAAVICPEDVKVYTYPSIPTYDCSGNTVLVYPSASAMTLEELFETQGINNGQKQEISRVIFIDSTWNQSSGMYKDPRLFKLPCIVLKSRITQFWRHQNGVPRWHLSTIEAIHQFFKEYEAVISKESEKLEKDSTSYCENYDNLLFFFRFMYDKIHILYDHDSLKSYKRPLK